MYYIEQNEKEVAKFKVHLYEEHLNDIRDRLIKNYSSIINIYNHFCFSNINKIETDRIKNYSNNTLKVNFSYYIYPELVVLIDMLMTGNATAIEKIINYKQKKVNMRDLYNENYLIKVINNICDDLNIEFTINDLMNALKDDKNVYINNEEHTFLKEEILSCMSFEKISSVELNEFYKMLDFLGLNSKDVFNNNISCKKRIKNNK